MSTQNFGGEKGRLRLGDRRKKAERDLRSINNYAYLYVVLTTTL